jgi:hypothetical protein
MQIFKSSLNFIIIFCLYQILIVWVFFILVLNQEEGKPDASHLFEGLKDIMK